ncbi:acyl carrier protein [Herbihabitans rhizosphaerae]|uniref:Acyl carrier protein n=1 Tax=Herbihabitans rhizosphaerae TaxID=1872711 RepID=A0A4Q7KFU6_9PSEU|nr:acyl carrier protein [Herbihabitans rhizosphaerae]RZS34103.1 acyl carrier protein [Herbihabitans rhizosphaerae]
MTTQLTHPHSEATVLEGLRAILLEVLGEYDADDTEITRDTTFHEDLGLESIDLVQVGQRLAEQYGEHVNLAAFLADMELDDVIGLRIGLLVDFVVDALSVQSGR